MIWEERRDSAGTDGGRNHDRTGFVLSLKVQKSSLSFEQPAGLDQHWGLLEEFQTSSSR